MKPLSVIEECQRLGALIIDMSKFDLMGDEPKVKKSDIITCLKCGGPILYSDFLYSFACPKCGDGQ